MALSTELKENWKEDKLNLQNGIISLQKGMSDYKSERKSEWKSFKNKFKEDMDVIKKSLKKITAQHKKKSS
jgi:hypothetical protein